jgi:hypothetical protein
LCGRRALPLEQFDGVNFFSQVGRDFDWEEQPFFPISQERISTNDDAPRKQRAAGASSQREALPSIPHPQFQKGPVTIGQPAFFLKSVFSFFFFFLCITGFP